MAIETTGLTKQLFYNIIPSSIPVLSSLRISRNQKSSECPKNKAHKNVWNFKLSIHRVVGTGTIAAKI